MLVRVKISPRDPRNRKTKNTQKNERLTLLDWQSGKNLEKTKKKSTHGWVWGEAGQVTWGETFLFFLFFHGFWGILGPRWQKLRENKKQTKQKVSTHGEGLRRSWTGDMGWNFFFGFCHGFGPVLSSFRIWSVCMRVWDRSKLQEWKQISRQDDFKQTVQNMRVSTMCAPSPPIILPSVCSNIKLHVSLKTESIHITYIHTYIYIQLYTYVCKYRETDRERESKMAYRNIMAATFQVAKCIFLVTQSAWNQKRAGQQNIHPAFQKRTCPSGRFPACTAARSSAEMVRHVALPDQGFEHLTLVRKSYNWHRLQKFLSQRSSKRSNLHSTMPRAHLPFFEHPNLLAQLNQAVKKKQTYHKVRRLSLILSLWQGLPPHSVLKPLETCWNLLKPIETSWNLLKPVETYCNL